MQPIKDRAASPVKYKKLDPRAIAPAYATPGSAAFDLAVLDDVKVSLGITLMARTGLVIETPADHMLMILPRSSTWKRWGIRLGNTVGVVDSDYCGDEDEIFLALWCPPGGGRFGPVAIPAGTRVAQGAFIPVSTPDFGEVATVSTSSRGGWGSTG